MDHNFWHWLLINLLEWIVRRYLPLFPTHEYWDLPALVLQYGGELFLISLVFMGQFIHLGTLARVVAIIILIELWKNKAKILKVLAFIRFLI